jgi:hypothetical protein
MGCSVTLHLLEQHSQPLARSFNPHLQGGYTDTGDHRHIVVPQFLDVLQQERFPLIVIEQLQGAIQLFAPSRALRRVLLGGGQEGDFVVDEGSLPPTPPRSGSPAAISQDAEEPGSESLWFIALG